MSVIEQAERMKNAPLSRIRHFVDYANQLESQGKSIIHLEIGEPDFNTPSYINEAAKLALDQNRVHYANVRGLNSLREAIAEHVQNRHGVSYTPEEILVTNGVAHGIFLAIMAFLNPNDEILIPDPGYLCYGTVPNIAGARAIPYRLKEETGFQIDFDDLKCLVTDKTRAIVLISPSNPCGTVLSEETQRRVADFAVKHNLLVISDEIYEDIVYDNVQTKTIARLPGMRERTIVMSGFSKYYAMTGWRIGYLLCTKTLLDPLLRLGFYSIACVNTFVQYAAEAALRANDSDSRKMVAEYKRRRDYLASEVNRLPGCCCHIPEGAFYILMNIKETGLTAEDFAKYMLDTAGVAMVPGSIFGLNGEGYVRLSYASSLENLREAVGRMKAALDELLTKPAKENKTL